MADRLPTSSAGTATTVVVCCAGDQAEAIAAADQLAVRGRSVRLLDGIDLDPRALAATLADLRGEGLYVLVRGGGLGREQLDALREVLLAHRVPFARTLTVASAAAGELVQRIEAGLEKIGGAGAGVAASATPARARRSTVHAVAPTKPAIEAPTTRAAAPVSTKPPATTRVESPPVMRPIEASAPPPAPDAAAPRDDTQSNAEQDTRVDSVVAAIEVDAELLEDSLAHGRRPSADDVELPSVVDLAGVLDGIGEGPDPIVPKSRVVTLVAPAIPFEGYGDEAELSLRDGEIIDEPDPIDRTQVAAVDRTVVARIDRTVIAAVPAPPSPPPPATTRPEVAAPSAPLVPVPARRGNARWISAAVVSVVGLALVGALVMRPGDDSGSAEPSTRAAALAETTPPPAPVADVTPRPAPQPPAPLADPKPAEPAVDPTPADPKPTRATPPAIDPPASRNRPPVASASVPSTRVQAALRARTIRALDILLVARKVAGPMSFAKASTHCADLDVGGIGHWRLPELGELASLSDAGMIGDGTFWSRTSADTFGDSHMAWSARARQAAQRFKAAAVLCVRGDRDET